MKNDFELQNVTKQLRKLTTSYERVTKQLRKFTKSYKKLQTSYEKRFVRVMFRNLGKMASLEGPQDNPRQNSTFALVAVSEAMKSHFIDKNAHFEIN